MAVLSICAVDPAALESALAAYDIHELALFRPLFLKLHVTITLCIKRVVTPNADICSGVNTRAALANDDIACGYLLAAIDFDAKSLGF